MSDNVILYSKYILIFVLAFVVSVVGATYAYFSFSKSEDGVITGDAAMVNLTLNVSKVLPNSQNNNVIVPQFGGSILENAIRNGCVDDNSNIVCQVYKVDVTNGGSANLVVDGSVSFFSDEDMKNGLQSVIPNMKWSLISSFDEGDVSSLILGNNSVNVAGSDDVNFVHDITIVPNEKNIYYFVVWLNETGSPQDGANSSFFGNVSFVSSNGNGVTAVFSGY